MHGHPWGCRGAGGLLTLVLNVLAQLSQGGEAAASLRATASAAAWEGTAAVAGHGAWQAGGSSEPEE